MRNITLKVLLHLDLCNRTGKEMNGYLELGSIIPLNILIFSLF